MATQAHSFLQGEVIEGKFPLRQYLGGSRHSAVFLTQYGEARPRDAAIKLVPAPPGNSEAQLSRWRLAANLSHPNLIRIFDMGRCEVANTAMLYVVSELASENLGEIVPERALSPAETREMLVPMVDVLAFLHSRGFVHGHVQPSNIMAVGEALKLSSDGLYRLNDSLEDTGLVDPYDPPEGTRNGASPAGDLWSLGIILVEVLTQHRPSWTASDRRDPVVPDELMPPPFAEFARHCLKREPKSRWSAADIRAHLPRAPIPAAPTPEPVKLPTAVAAPRAAVPAEPLIPIRERLAELSEIAAAAIRRGSKIAAAARPHWKIDVQQLRRYGMGGITAAAALVLIIVAVKVAGHRRPLTPSQAPASIAPAQASLKPEHQPPNGIARPAQKRATSHPEQPGSEEAKAQSVEPKVTPPPAAPVASVPIEPANGATPTASTELTPGHVVHRILPDIPRSASATIWGTVRVNVKAIVDASGAVTTAELESVGPSKYFARLSVEAARQWQFDPAKENGQAVGSVWLLRFGYTNRGSTVSPAQVQP